MGVDRDSDLGQISEALLTDRDKRAQLKMQRHAERDLTRAQVELNASGKTIISFLKGTRGKETRRTLTARAAFIKAQDRLQVVTEISGLVYKPNKDLFTILGNLPAGTALPNGEILPSSTPITVEVFSVPQPRSSFVKRSSGGYSATDCKATVGGEIAAKDLAYDLAIRYQSPLRERNKI